MPSGRMRASTTANSTADCSHPFSDISKFLRPQQSGEQIGKQYNGENDDDRGRDIHGGLPQFFASLDIPERDGEKGDGQEKSKQVPHESVLPVVTWAASFGADATAATHCFH